MIQRAIPWIAAKHSMCMLEVAILLLAAASVTMPVACAKTNSQPLKSAEQRSSEPDAPEVETIKPASITPGSQTTIQVSGKHFAQDARVCFSSPGILVLRTDFNKSSKLTAHIQVAQDAPVGATSLFVVNPDESEAEVPFEVSQGEAVITEHSAASATAPGRKRTSKSSQSSSVTQTFQVLSLAEAINVLKNPNLPKGTLSLAGGKLSYQEGGNEVFNVAVKEIKEVASNTLFGINTGTFHIILSSGKTYNFIAGSLKPQDTENIVASLQKALL